jgi:hypothetical protein
MPPLDIAPVAAGAAPVAHLPANYEPVGRVLRANAAAMLGERPVASSQIYFNDELLVELRPLCLYSEHDGALNIRLLERAQRWKRKAQITPHDFDRVVGGSIAMALRGSRENRAASWAMTHDPETANAQRNSHEGFWAYPTVTIAMVINCEAGVWEWLASKVMPRTRYEL